MKEQLEVGDKIWVYTRRGANVRGEVTQIDENGRAYIFVNRSSRFGSTSRCPHPATGWYKPRRSARGIWYASEYHQ